MFESANMNLIHKMRRYGCQHSGSGMMNDGKDVFLVHTCDPLEKLIKPDLTPTFYQAGHAAHR